MQKNTAKNFVLQLGSLASLYLSLSFFLVLVFGLVNLLYPDTLDNVWQMESSASQVRFGFAMTIVFFPTYLYLTRLVNKHRRHSTDHAYLGLTRWLIYLSLLIAGGVLLGDLVAIIMGLLEGELTIRFILKASAVLIVTGAAFFYYAKDAQGYWIQNERLSVVYGAIAATFIFGTLLVAINTISGPSEVREIKADQQQVNDLRTLQWRIESYLQTNGELPSSLEDLRPDRQREEFLPESPEGRAPYEYKLTDSGFALCAVFERSASETEYPTHGRFASDNPTPYIVNSEDWYYEAGEWCFERSVVEST